MDCQPKHRARHIRKTDKQHKGREGHTEEEGGDKKGFHCITRADGTRLLSSLAALRNDLSGITTS